MRMPLPTVSGSLGACAKRTSIVDDSSAIVVFIRCLRMRSLVSQLWHDAHTHNTFVAQENMTVIVAETSSIVGCFVPSALFF